MSEKMIFCKGDGPNTKSGPAYQKSYCIFNKQVSKSVWEDAYGSMQVIELPISAWVDKKNMTDAEKKNVSGWEQTGGYLKTLGYKEAWKEVWPKVTQKQKDWIKNLPNFDAALFTDITGIVFGEDSLVGQEATVEIGGKKYRAQIVSEE